MANDIRNAISDNVDVTNELKKLIHKVSTQIKRQLYSGEISLQEAAPAIKAVADLANQVRGQMKILIENKEKLKLDEAMEGIEDDTDVSEAINLLDNLMDGS